MMSADDMRQATETPTCSGYESVDGRRYRVTDPNIKASLRRQLIAELLTARRDLGRARKANHLQKQHRAECRIDNAKIALGERGPEWWRTMTAEQWQIRIVATALSLLHCRGTAGSITALEIATVVDGREPHVRIPQIIDVVLQGVENALFAVSPGDTRDKADAIGSVNIRRGEQFDAARFVRSRSRNP